MSEEQEPCEALDLSVTLRSIMATRGLSVTDMARLAGVSRSAMEKYLAGPSSPRAVAVASLAKALGYSADNLMFGEPGFGGETAARVAFDAFAELLRDLKSDPELANQFEHLKPGSEGLSDFIRKVAYERSTVFKHRFDEFSGDHRIILYPAVKH